LLAALLLACGGNGARVPASARSAADSRAAFAVAPPLVTPGERMVYRIQLRGVELAAMTFGVGEITELGGKRSIVVQGQAKSVGLAEMLAAVDDTFTSWLDVQTGRSLRFAVDEFASGSKIDVEHTVAELAQREGDMVPVQFSLNSATPTPEPQKLSLPEVWDYNGFLIALRSWEGKPGARLSVEVFRSRWLWHVDMKIGGRETLTTELGELPALRFEGHTYRLDRKGGRDHSAEPRDFMIWISDDDGRVPLKVKARTDYGDVTMDIADYQPGTGQRLR
jgi:hypothetical protein